MLVRGSWVPAALWVVTLLYLRPYDGWGAWAAAPLLLPTLVFSAVWVLAGMFLTGRRFMARRRPDPVVIGAALLGGAPALYYTLRYLWRA